MKYRLLTIDKVKTNNYFLKEIPYLFNKELSGKESVFNVFLLTDTTKQDIYDFLKMASFRINPFMSWGMKSDFDAVLNIHGFAIPGWLYMSKILPKKLQSIFISKLSPGKERLHLRFYNVKNNEWLITAHTDKGLFTINFFRSYSNHVKSGAGNYKSGTALLTKLLDIYINGTREALEKYVNNLSVTNL